MEIKKELRSFKSSEQFSEKGDGPYRGFGYLSLFSFQLRKVIIRFKRIEYNINVMRQSALYVLVFNPITVDSYASFLFGWRVRHQAL